MTNLNHNSSNLQNQTNTNEESQSKTEKKLKGNRMRYLSDYMEERQTKAFTKYGAFFAFSKKQMNEKKQENIKYSMVGSGLICPTVWDDRLLDELENIYKSCIQQDIADNGMEAIITRELHNHEFGYTFDFTDTIEKLQDYPCSIQDIKLVANKIDWSEY